MMKLPQISDQQSITKMNPHPEVYPTHTGQSNEWVAADARALNSSSADEVTVYDE
jgi:hypothetical protein